MSEHPIQGLMDSAMENLKGMIDVNTIIGDPVHTPDGSVILTVSKVGFGFAAGGSEFVGRVEKKDNATQQGSITKHPFGGGSGAGVSITPIAFLIVNSNGIQMLHLDEKTHLIEKVFDAAPAAFDKIKSMVGKNTDSTVSFEPDPSLGLGGENI